MGIHLLGIDGNYLHWDTGIGDIAMGYDKIYMDIIGINVHWDFGVNNTTWIHSNTQFKYVQMGPRTVIWLTKGMPMEKL